MADDAGADASATTHRRAGGEYRQKALSRDPAGYGEHGPRVYGARKWPLSTYVGYRAGVSDILGLDTLFAEMILGIGVALVAGNGFALWKHRRGERPREVKAEAPFRTGRVWFLMAVGALMTVWGIVSVFWG